MKVNLTEELPYIRHPSKYSEVYDRLSEITEEIHMEVVPEEGDSIDSMSSTIRYYINRRGLSSKYRVALRRNTLYIILRKD